jgi:hypothetical protein
MNNIKELLFSKMEVEDQKTFTSLVNEGLEISLKCLKIITDNNDTREDGVFLDQAEVRTEQLIYAFNVLLDKYRMQLKEQMVNEISILVDQIPQQELSSFMEKFFNLQESVTRGSSVFLGADQL